MGAEDNKDRNKDKDSSLEDRLRELAPKLIGAGTALCAYFLIKDSGVDLVGFGRIGELPEWMKILEASWVGWIAYRVSDRIAFNFLFNRKERSASGIEDVAEERDDKTEIPEKITLGSRIRNIPVWLLEHPKTTSFAVTLKGLHEFIIQPAYEWVYKASVNKGIIEDYLQRNMHNLSDADIAKYEKLVSDADKVIDTVVLQVLPMGIFIYCGLYGATTELIALADTILNPKHGRYARKRLKAAVIEGYDHEGAMTALEEAINIMPSREAHFQLAGLHAKKGSMDLALREYSKGIRQPKMRIPIDDLNKLMEVLVNPYLTSYKRYNRGIRKHPDNVSDHINLAVLHWKNENKQMAYDAMNRAEKMFEGDAGLRCLDSVMLEHDDPDKSRVKLREAFNILKNDPGIAQKMRLVDESAHKVYELKSDFLAEVFKFKEGRKDDLLKEIMFVLYLERMMGSQAKFDIAKPIDFFESGAGWVYVMKHLDGVPISSIADKGYRHFIAAAEALGVVHAVMPRTLDRDKTLARLAGRIKECRFIDDGSKTTLYDYCRHIAHSLEDSPLVFMKDHHGGNIRIRRTARKDEGPASHGFNPVLFDFDYKGVGPRIFDTVKLTEQGRCFENDVSGFLMRFKVLGRYALSFNEREKDSRMRIDSPERLFMDHLRSSLVKALSFYFFSLKMPRKEDERVSFLDNSVYCLSMVGKYFTHEYKQQSGLYDKVVEVIDNLPKTNSELAPLID